MPRIPSLYRLVASFLVMSILTSGIAMAAYVCPQMAVPAQAMEMVMDGQPCTDMDQEKPVQCAEFRSGSQLAIEYLAVQPALTPVLVAIMRPAPVLVFPAVPVFVRDVALPTAGADPPYLRTQRLRI